MCLACSVYSHAPCNKAVTGFWVSGALTIGSWFADDGGGGDSLGSKVGTGVGIATPCIALLVWLAVTYSYRREKHALVAAVTSQLTPAHVAEKADVQRDDSETLSRPSEHDDSSTADFITAAQRETETTPAMLKVAKDMTQRCLRRWDSILAFRASTDSQGNGQGIWRDRYLGVRASVMLLALHNLNTHLQANHAMPYDGNPSKLFLQHIAWQAIQDLACGVTSLSQLNLDLCCCVVACLKTQHLWVMC